MADKKLKIGLQVDPKGFKDAERYLARLRAEGLKVSKALQGQVGGGSFSSGAGRMNFTKNLLGDPKVLESWGKSAEKASKILKEISERELKKLETAYERLNKGLDKSIEKHERLKKAMEGLSGPALHRAQARLDKYEQRGLMVYHARREALRETLEASRGGGGGGGAGGVFGGGSFWAKTALATAIAGALAYIVDRNLGSFNRWDVSKAGFYAGSVDFGNQMQVSALSNNYRPYLALNAPIESKYKAEGGERETVQDALKRIAESNTRYGVRHFFDTVKTGLSFDVIGMIQKMFNSGEAVEAIKAAISQEMIRAGEKVTAVDSRVLDYFSQHALPRVKSARHYAYEGMKDVYKWMPWSLGPEGEGIQLLGQYSQTAGAYAASKTATRDMAVRLAKIGVTGGGAQAFAGMLTGTGGDVEQAAKKTEDIFARAFERGLRNRFLEEFGAVVARATLAGGGRTDATAYGQFLATMLGKDPDPQKIRSVLGGTAALDAFYAGQSGGSYFQVGGVTAARRALMGANAAGARYGSIDAAILGTTELKHLFPGGMSAELKTLGFDRPEMRPFLNQYISERFGQLVGAFGTKELRGAWAGAGGDFGKFLDNADIRDLTRFGFMLRHSGIVKDQTEFVEMLNAMGGRYGQKGQDDLKQIKGDLASSSELAHVTDEAEMASKLRKKAHESAKKFDEARETAKRFVDKMEEWAKFVGDLAPTTIALKELTTAAKEAAEALYGVAKKPTKPPRDPTAPLAPSALTIGPLPTKRVTWHAVPPHLQHLTEEGE